MTFRLRSLAAMAGLVGALVAATLMGQRLLIRREIVARLNADLDSAVRAFSEQLLRDSERLRSEAQVVAEEPRIKALLNTPDVDADTLADVADETRVAVGWDVLGFATSDGAAHAVSGLRFGAPLPAPLAGRGADEHAVYWADDHTAYEAWTIPVQFSGQVIGVLYAANRLDETRLGQMAQQMRIALGIVDQGRSLAFAWPGRRTDVAFAPSAFAAPDREVHVGDDSFLTRLVPLPGSSLQAWVLLPEGPALAPYQRFQRAVVALGVGAMVLALVIAGVLSRGLARPITDLTQMSVALGAGDLTARVFPSGGAELESLGTTFNVMAIELDRSRTELKRAEALRRELEIARSIQTGLLPAGESPPGFEVAARMRPATQVGGDFYDLIPVADGFWVLIGDVSGHGLNAGLLMLILQAAAMSRIMADPGLDPRALVDHLNVVFHHELQRLQSREYATLMALRYRSASGFCFAGGHQPMFVSRLDGTVEVIESQGPWCGIDPQAGRSLETRELELRAGERLWLVTDGILEAQDARGGLFGDARLARWVGSAANQPLRDAVDMLFAEVDAFITSQEDDMTAVALQRAPDPTAGVAHG